MSIKRRPPALEPVIISPESTPPDSRDAVSGETHSREAPSHDTMPSQPDARDTLRAQMHSDLVATRKRKRRGSTTGRRLPALFAAGFEEFLRVASLLPVESGPEAVARSVCDLLRALRPSVAVGVVLPGEGIAGAALLVTAAPLLPSIRREDERVSEVEGPRSLSAAPDYDPNRLFPDLDDEWIIRLPAPNDGVALHVAGALEGQMDPDRELHELTERASILLASGLRGAQQIRRSRGESSQLRELQARIVQSEKLASIGQIAAKVVHELNNPLTAIVAYADFLTKKLERQHNDPADVERLRRIGEAAERILRFSRDLTTYARPNDDMADDLPVGEVVERAVVFCDHIAGALKVRVVVEVDPSTPRVRARRGQLTQVFVNLITNACHAIQDAARSEDGEVRILIGPREKGGAQVTVGDNGGGISPQNLVRIFDPFFTTKPEGRGTGLGLSIVCSIVEEHGGRVWARSVVGQGTQFIVELPE